jgi:hypothetical protein
MMDVQYNPTIGINTISNLLPNSSILTWPYVRPESFFKILMGPSWNVAVLSEQSQ